MENRTSVIEIDHVTKSFGEFVAVDDAHFSIAQGEFFSMLGPSGCGKTTTLRMIAGFEQPTTGAIRLDGVDVSRVPPNKRDVNTVFQQYALFPHMNVYDNVAFGPRSRKASKAEIARRVPELLEIVRLGDFAARRPAQLSGGQQQRVALARALVNLPKALLLDEPLGALDLKLRHAMQFELKRIQREVGITFVYVTHDQEEALSISDQVCVMFDGVVQQVGSPWAIYRQPANRFVAGFVGSNNFLPLRLEAGRPASLLGQPIDLPGPVQGRQGATAAVRPEQWRVNQVPGKPGLQVQGVLRQAMFTGRELQLFVEVAGHGVLEALTAPDDGMVAIQPGDPVSLAVAAADIQYFAEGDAGARLS